MVFPSSLNAFLLECNPYIQATRGDPDDIRCAQRRRALTTVSLNFKFLCWTNIIIGDRVPNMTKRKSRAGSL